MTKIQSSVTDLPTNCRSAADHMVQALAAEDRFADLPDSCLQKLTELEHVISKETGENIALVAYRFQTGPQK